jgi:hypothetical protein
MQKRDLKVGAAGMAIGAATLVGVYEGRVAVSHAAERLELTAGQAATVDDAGVHAAGDVDSALRAMGERNEEDEDPTLAANRNLADTVQAYRRRLDDIALEKVRLQRQLDAANAKLAETADAPGVIPAKNREYDLSQQDWKHLAEKGQVKFRMPCSPKNGWWPSDGQAKALGLAPNDLPIVQAAYKRSYERVWGEIRPLCAKALSPEVADRLGAQVCPQALISLAQAEKGWDAVADVIQDVANVRAGLKEVASSSQDPVEQVFMMWTSALSKLEADLAQSLGPDDAHRILYSDAACAWNEDWDSNK